MVPIKIYLTKDTAYVFVKKTQIWPTSSDKKVAMGFLYFLSFIQLLYMVCFYWSKKGLKTWFERAQK